METWVNWALFLALVGAGYFYYSKNDLGTERGRSATRDSIVGSANDANDWLKTETKKVVKTAKAKAPRKSVKTAAQETANKAKAALSQASSTAGADADDDLSPVASPSFAMDKTPSGRDVSDMLDPKISTPSVLSIKPSEKAGRSAKPQAPKAEPEKESKKARQNRRKVEEAKTAREADEKERQALLEKQRRIAREARGEPAKNGLQAAKAPASSAWTTVRSSGAVQPPASAPTGQLLDTFDAASVASSSDAPTNGAIKTPDSLSNGAHQNNALSEEDQVKMALEDTSAWETVPKGGKKQRKRVAGGETTEDEGDVAPQVAQSIKPVHIDKFVRPTIPENKKPTSRYQILQDDVTTGADSADDWPVA
jgi:hypothetical protein